MLALVLALTLGASDIQCLTDTVFHEARDQNDKGQYLVYRSVVNRVKDKRWPNTICGVTNQYKQYSYTLERPEVLRTKIRKEQSTYDKIKLLTKTWYTLKAKPLKGFEGVNHYLRCDIIHKTKWTSKMTFLGREGDHCFYKG